VSGVGTLTADLAEAGAGLPEVCGVFALRNISSQVDGCFIHKGTEGLRVATDGGEPVVIWETVALGGNNGFLRHRALMRPADVPLDALGVLVNKPQTAWGLALRLTAWEPESSIWDKTIAEAAATMSQLWSRNKIQSMAARIEQVGMDNAVRRELWAAEVEPGTLATLQRHADGEWSLFNGEGVQVFSADAVTASKLDTVIHAPALTGITDPIEALRAIYAEVCS